MTNLTEKNTILRATVGSHLFGLNTPESDIDEMGVCVETIEQIAGFHQFEQEESKHPDIVIYGLKKYLHLALKGNPTILTLLFAPKDMCSVRTPLGAALQGLAPNIVSRSAGNAFLGYLIAQRRRLTGEQGGKDVNRPELVAKYGYDTKYAMHMLRLGYQGIELLMTGKIQLPMCNNHREILMSVRNGKQTIEYCYKESELLEELLKHQITHSDLPDQPDRDYIEKWLVKLYKDVW